MLFWTQTICTECSRSGICSLARDCLHLLFFILSVFCSRFDVCVCVLCRSPLGHVFYAHLMCRRCIIFNWSNINFPSNERDILCMMVVMVAVAVTKKAHIVFFTLVRSYFPCLHCYRFYSCSFEFQSASYEYFFPSIFFHSSSSISIFCTTSSMWGRASRRTHTFDTMEFRFISFFFFFSFYIVFLLCCIKLVFVNVGVCLWFCNTQQILAF